MKWDWRKYLTLPERELIRISDRELEQIEKMRADYGKRWQRRRQLIVNRAIQRAKFEARK